MDLLIVEDNIKEYRKEAVNYIDSMILCKTIDEVHECDKAFHARRCHEIDSTGEGGMYKEMYKEVYRDFEANRQINAIIKEGNRLLNGAKKERLQKYLALDRLREKNFCRQIVLSGILKQRCSIAKEKKRRR